MSTTEKQTLRPTGFAWILGVVSTLGYLYCMWGVMVTGELLRKEVAADRLRLALDGSNLPLARGFFYKAVKAEGLAGWFSIGNDLNTPLGDYLSVALQAIEHSASDQFVEARKQVEVLRAKSSEIPALSTAIPAIHTALDTAVPFLDRLSTLRESIDTLSTSRYEAVEERRKLLTSFKILAQEFADFFSLPLESALDEHSLPVYTKGVLKDLPQLKGIPDDVDSLTSLARSLEYARGQVKIPKGENAHHAFTSRMEYFKEGIYPTAAQFRKLERTISGLDTKIVRFRGEVDGERKSMEGALRTVLFVSLERGRAVSSGLWDEVANLLKYLI